MARGDLGLAVCFMSAIGGSSGACRRTRRADTAQPDCSVSVRCCTLPRLLLGAFVIKQQFSDGERMNFSVKQANSL